MHIGHAKSICLNFGIAEEFNVGGVWCRFEVVTVGPTIPTTHLSKPWEEGGLIQQHGGQAPPPERGLA